MDESTAYAIVGKAFSSSTPEGAVELARQGLAEEGAEAVLVSLFRN